MSDGVLQTTCRMYVTQKAAEDCKKYSLGGALSPDAQKEIETRAMLNAIVCYIDQYFPVQNRPKKGESLRGRPRNLVHQLMVEHKAMREALEYYRAKDIASLADAKRDIEDKPWLDAPPLCDWSVAHKCLQEIESEET